MATRAYVLPSMTPLMSCWTNIGLPAALFQRLPMAVLGAQDDRLELRIAIGIEADIADDARKVAQPGQAAANAVAIGGKIVRLVGHAGFFNACLHDEERIVHQRVGIARARLGARAESRHPFLN